MAYVVDLAVRSRSHRVWLAAGAWTAVASVVAVILRTQGSLPLLTAILSTCVWYYTLGALVWGACALHVRWKLWKQAPAGMSLAHAVICTVAMAVWMMVMVVFARVSIGPDYWRIVFGDWWMFQLLSNAMTYAVGVGIGLSVHASDREHERRQREARLEALAREAELTAIKAQLQPHFLFNALNSILALLEHDPAEARRMLMRLASLLHSMFDRFDEPLVPLEREFETIRDYLEIERIRFGDRMTFSVEAERAASRVPVPPFILQPIVENAVKHGIEPHPRPGAVRVTGRVDGTRLRLAVADTGPGVNGGDRSAGHGRGLELTRRRLGTVYGPDAAMLQAERGDCGFTVTLDLPVATDVDIA